MTRTSIQEDNDIKKKIVQAVREAHVPVGVDFIAKAFALNWSTTRALLMALSLEGRLRARKTTMGWIFESAT